MSIENMEEVSIRALTRRATCLPGPCGNSCCFNSCPHAEGNAIACELKPEYFGFNSCPHAEGNQQDYKAVSEEKVFQFVPSRGGQPALNPQQQQIILFQFVPSRGGQHSAGAGGGYAAGFNSCPHAEGNWRLSRLSSIYGRFQFVPSRGGQPGLSGKPGRSSRVSIRALTRRATVFF